MQLSQKYSIDPNEPWVIKHNNEVHEVLEAFYKDNPVRVPLLCNEWFGQHGFYADEIGLDYRKYYTNPDLMLEVQLEAARRRREIPVYDMVLCESPERWMIAVDFWPIAAPGWFGCELLYREDCVIANHRLDLSKEECDRLEMPDPLNGGIMKTMMQFWRYLREKYEGKLTYLGKPVEPICLGAGTNGLFCLALDLRGPEIMADMYDDPDFVHRFLRKVANWGYSLDCTEAKLKGVPAYAFDFSDHGIDMLSAELYEEFIIPVVKEMNERIGKVPSSEFHHCGRGTHLFPAVKKHFNFNSINNLTFPMNDVAKVRNTLGEDVWVTVLIEDSIIKEGPPERIRHTVKDLMQSGAKGNGRLSLAVGDMLRGTSLENVAILYEAVKEFGTY